jgi:hypothetical protein
MRTHRVLRVMMFLPLVVLFVALFGFVVMSLWNWLMPALFGLKTIGYWQALGLFLLCKILFGGFRRSGGWGGRWRHRMRERWEKMTPEERERFRQGFCSSWGRVAPPESKPSS